MSTEIVHLHVGNLTGQWRQRNTCVSVEAKVIICGGFKPESEQKGSNMASWDCEKEESYLWWKISEICRLIETGRKRKWKIAWRRDEEQVFFLWENFIKIWLRIKEACANKIHLRCKGKRVGGNHCPASDTRIIDRMNVKVSSCTTACDVVRINQEIALIKYITYNASFFKKK